MGGEADCEESRRRGEKRGWEKLRGGSGKIGFGRVRKSMGKRKI